MGQQQDELTDMTWEPVGNNVQIHATMCGPVIVVRHPNESEAHMQARFDKKRRGYLRYYMRYVRHSLR